MTTNNRARTPLQQKADRFDVIVVGAGPGGYVAAIRAAQHGLRVAVVERGELGGVCSNVGCIPTKAMLHGADVAHEIATAGALGFSVGEVSFDISGLVDHSRQVVDQLTTGIRGLLDANGVEIIVGNATVPQKGRVKVEVAKSFRELHSDHIILATGARPRSIPGVEPDGDRVWTSTEALRPSSLPASLLIIGSGAIGAEFASLYRDLGTEVTLVEALPGILPAEDAEVSAFVAKQFLARGIDVRTSVTVVSVVPDPSEETGGVTTTFTTSDGASHSVVTERVLVATGVTPNSEGLGLESLGAKLERGFVKTDQWCRTGVAGLYAIGDLAGGPCLAHKASHEAVLCVDHIVGEAGVKPLDRDFVPGCTYSRPQVASIGLTEAQARERVGAAGGGAGVGGVRVGKFNLVGNGKALALGEPEGFVKTVFDGATGELLGAHLVGPAVTEMVQGFGVAHSLHATAEDLAEVVFPHPTVSEAMHESVLDALDRVIHWPPARR
ncbi:MAG: dihydrolipoyl dehydrogenase [Mycobacteriaceae bacterium]|uniref:Dihydrolipoyl dehydrogenase n=3 Tax=Corynebacterium variabile TaxID=1727 RepID=A0A0X2NJI3_9CORY|nr:dihydrolipoyl dehydrogenase [Corynebacterium variabile]CUU65657.1 dihydrolipoamide dehydrogenase [Corynebacterium variabile]